MQVFVSGLSGVCNSTASLKGSGGPGFVIWDQRGL